MTPAAHAYRKIAAELNAKALDAPSDGAAAELDHLARSYLGLAEQAEINAHYYVAVEFGPKSRLG